MRLRRTSLLPCSVARLAPELAKPMPAQLGLLADAALRCGGYRTRPMWLFAYAFYRHRLNRLVASRFAY